MRFFCGIYFPLVLLLFLFQPSFAQAQGTDFAETHHYTLKYRQQIDDYLAGRPNKMNNEYQIRNLCYSVAGFAATEMGKLKYNDQFGEVQNEEQAQDIQRLNDALAKETDCKKRFRIWVAYDDKWYYQKRKMQDAKNKEQEKVWASQVVDTGADVWDGVINGTFFAIPRKYMWAGRNKPDGFGLAVNLLLFYPGMEDKSASANKDRTDLNVLLEQAIIKKERPCPAHDKQTCTGYTYQIGAWAAEYLDCASEVPYERHHAVWRKSCKYKEGQKRNLTPEFDEEVNMWRIGIAGYYEGSPEFPDYWFICGKPGSDWNKHYAVQSCTGAVYVTDGVYAQYHFRQKEGFWHHREIHDQLQKKLQSFIVKTDNPYLVTGE